MLGYEKDERFSLGFLQRFAYVRFKNVAYKFKNDKLEKKLRSAHMEIRADAYRSYVFFISLILFIVSTVSVFSINYFIPHGIKNVFYEPAALFPLPLIVATISYIALINKPVIKAWVRGRKIDSHLPFTLSSITAMSAADMDLTEIFKTISKQKIYGEVKKEAEWICRDVFLMGNDLVTALEKNNRFTPSERFKELVNGMVLTVKTGNSLSNYLLKKEKQQRELNNERQQKNLELLGYLSKSYVLWEILLALIITPWLFFNVLNNDKNLLYLYIITIIVTPIVTMFFSALAKSTAQKADI